MPDPDVIDLGVYRPGSGADTVPDPWWPSWWRRRRVLVLRWMPALLAVVLAFSPGGAAAPATPLLRQIWAVDAADIQPSRYVVGRDRLFLARPGRLTAHRLVDGGVDWEAQLDGPGGIPGVWLSAGVLMVTVSGGGSHTGAYDPATGDRLWSQPDTWVREAGDRFLMLGRSTEPDAPDELLQEVVTIDPGTGRATGSVWLAAAAAHSLVEWEPPDGESYLFGLDYDGVIVRIDLADLATDSVPTPHGEREPGTRQNQLQVAGGLVLVTASKVDAPRVLAAYDPVTLTHRWSVPGGLYVDPCGPFVCVNVRAGSQEHVQAVDPATGETHWTLRCPQDAPAGQECSPSVRELEPDNRLWVTLRMRAGYDPDHHRSWIADAPTGERLTGTMQGWRLEHQVGDSSLLLTRLEPGAQQRLDEGEPYRAWWARSDSQLGSIETLGAVEAHSCQLQYPYLACWTETRGLATWQFMS